MYSQPKNIRWHFVWTSFLALFFSLGAFILFQWVYAFADDHCFWKIQGDTVLLTEILPGGVAERAGLQNGDELLEIDGIKCQPRALIKIQGHMNAKPVNRLLVYKVRRQLPDGSFQVFQAPVKVVKPFNLRMLLTMIAGLASWTVGLMVVASSPQTRIAQHFYYLCLGSLLLVITMPGNMIGNPPKSIMLGVLVLSFLVYALLPPLWLHFFLRFPHPFSWSANRRFLTALYTAFAGLALIMVLPRMMEVFEIPPSGYFSPLFRRSLLWIRRIATSVDMLIGVALFWMGVFKVQGKRRKALLPTLIFTTLVMADILIYFLLSHVYEGHTMAFNRSSWVFFLPLPLAPISFAYAILKHGLFDIHGVLIRWLSYFLVIGLSLAAYLTGVAWIFVHGLSALSPAWIAVALGLAAIPMAWLLRWLMLMLRRIFHRDLISARDMIIGRLHMNDNRLSEDTVMQNFKTSLREAFRPRLLLLLPVEGLCITLPALENAPDAMPITFELPESLLCQARESGDLVIGLTPEESEWIRNGSPELRRRLEAMEAQIMVLLLSGSRAHSAVFLGGKYAELNYSKEDRQMLNEVSQAAGIVLETTVLHHRLLHQGRIEQEFQTARKIQQSLVTTEAPETPGFQMAMRMEAAFETGGDLLWVQRRPNGKWIAAVGDVSGKGLPAALYMSQATALLKFAVLVESMDLEHLLSALDRTMRNIMSPKDYLTMTLLEWDEQGRYRLARAGHPAPLLISERTLSCQARGRGLGLRPALPGNWEILEGTLEPGEWIVMFSDGLTEAMNQEGEVFGMERLAALLRQAWASGSIRSACESVYHQVIAFEAKNKDDRTLFILGRDAL